MADIQTFYDQETANVLSYLIEITHPSISPVYYCSNNEDIVYDGKTYSANNLTATLLSDSNNMISGASVNIQNISSDIRDIFSGLYTSAVVKVALYNSLGNIEKGFYTFECVNIDYNYTDAALTLINDLGFDYEYPRYRYDRSFGGLES